LPICATSTTSIPTPLIMRPPYGGPPSMWLWPVRTSGRATSTCSAVRGYSTVTDFARLRGWSTSRPFAVESAIAQICSGTTASSGESSVGDSGTQKVSSAEGRTASSPSSAMTSVRAPRARRSWVLELTLDSRPRLALVDERDRPVLELARREALRVDVRELLELERALERDREADVPAEEQHRRRVLHRPGGRAHVLAALDDRLDLARHVAQVLEDRGDLVGELVPAQLREVEAQEVGGRDLREERLGRGDRDLRAGVRVEHGVRLARDRRPVRVDDR